jgi:hypothetical protein
VRQAAAAVKQAVNGQQAALQAALSTMQVGADGRGVAGVWGGVGVGAWSRTRFMTWRCTRWDLVPHALTWRLQEREEASRRLHSELEASCRQAAAELAALQAEHSTTQGQLAAASARCEQLQAQVEGAGAAAQAAGAAAQQAAAAELAEARGQLAAAVGDREALQVGRQRGRPARALASSPPPPPPTLLPSCALASPLNNAAQGSTRVWLIIDQAR